MQRIRQSDAKKLAIRWAYFTNGHGIYPVDMGRDAVANGRNVIDGNHGTVKSHDSHASHKSHPLETEITNFPTPDELWNRTFAEQNAWRDRFAAVPFEDRGGYFQGRYYQDIAID